MGLGSRSLELWVLGHRVLVYRVLGCGSWILRAWSLGVWVLGLGVLGCGSWCLSLKQNTTHSTQHNSAEQCVKGAFATRTI